MGGEGGAVCCLQRGSQLVRVSCSCAAAAGLQVRAAGSLQPGGRSPSPTVPRPALTRPSCLLLLPRARLAPRSPSPAAWWFATLPAGGCTAPTAVPRSSQRCGALRWAGLRVLPMRSCCTAFIASSPLPLPPPAPGDGAAAGARHPLPRGRRLGGGHPAAGRLMQTSHTPGPSLPASTAVLMDMPLTCL